MTALSIFSAISQNSQNKRLSRIFATVKSNRDDLDAQREGSALTIRVPRTWSQEPGRWMGLKGGGIRGLSKARAMQLDVKLGSLGETGPGHAGRTRF
jgi:hypothetical protein